MMKSIMRISIIATLLISGLPGSLLSQTYNSWPHIPVSHSHPGYSICYGYAMARAFNPGSGCDEDGVYPSTKDMDGTYFSNESIAPDYSNVKQGDILGFEEDNGIPGHVAYVTSEGSSPSSIYLACIECDGCTSVKTGTLQDAISGGSNLIDRGNPYIVYKNKKLWQFTIRNKINGGYNLGKVKFNSGQHNSPYTTPKQYWNKSFTINTLEDGETHGGYEQGFDTWRYEGGVWNPENLSSQQSTQYMRHRKSQNSNTFFTADYAKKYNITFRNQFPGASGYPGNIEVAGQSESSPHVAKVAEENQVTAKALNQTYIAVSYSFDEWSDGYSSAQRTVTSTGDATYTAEFTGKPLPMSNYNLEVTSGVGEYITLEWDQHPNSNVKYQIWRIVKPQNQNQQDPELMTTLNHNATSWTDLEYIMTSSYTVDLLSYDVRAHFPGVGTADPDYLTVFGEGGLIKVADTNGEWAFTDGARPESFAVSAHPNPFNPSTKIAYELPEPASVTLMIFDVRGKRVLTLVDGEKPAGYYGIRWDGVNENGVRVASGIYFYRLFAKPFSGKSPVVESGKLLLAK